MKVRLSKNAKRIEIFRVDLLTANVLSFEMEDKLPLKFSFTQKKGELRIRIEED